MSTRRWTGVVDRVVSRYTYPAGVTPKCTDPSDFSKGGIMTASATTYAVVKTERNNLDAFAATRDGIEMTVVVEEGRVDEMAVIEIERGWKRPTFEVVLSFKFVGFLARVASVFTAEDISVFALLAYSTDHVLVREGDVATTAMKLGLLGGAVKHTRDSDSGNQRRSRLVSEQFDTSGSATLAVMVPDCDDSLSLVTDLDETDRTYTVRAEADPRPGLGSGPVTTRNHEESRLGITGAYGNA